MDKEKFMRLYKKGLNDYQIADELNCWHQNVQKFRNDLGLPVNSPGEKERMKLYNQGLGDSEIARRVGMSRSTIIVWRKNRNLPVNKKERPVLTREQHEERLRLWEAGYVDREIAEAVGVPKTHITRWRNENGIPVTDRLKRRKNVDSEN